MCVCDNCGCRVSLALYNLLAGVCPICNGNLVNNDDCEDVRLNTGAGPCDCSECLHSGGYSAAFRKESKTVRAAAEALAGNSVLLAKFEQELSAPLTLLLASASAGTLASSGLKFYFKVERLYLAKAAVTQDDKDTLAASPTHSPHEAQLSASDGWRESRATSHRTGLLFSLRVCVFSTYRRSSRRTCARRCFFISTNRRHGIPRPRSS